MTLREVMREACVAAQHLNLYVELFPWLQQAPTVRLALPEPPPPGSVKYFVSGLRRFLRSA